MMIDIRVSPWPEGPGCSIFFKLIATQFLFSVAMMAYLGYFNLLNFSCGIVPITKVTAEDVKNDVEGFPAKDMYHSEAKSVSIV